MAEDLIDLVWTGPEVEGIVNRDTAVVVREMFQNARESVFVAGYAVYQGQVVFKALAERIEQHPQLDVQIFLDIQRPYQDHSSPSELVRRFAERFARHEWPGRRFPRMFYDPRSLEIEAAKRASLHAKCIVVEPGAGIRLLGEFHGSGSYQEHRGWRSTAITGVGTATGSTL